MSDQGVIVHESNDISVGFANGPIPGLRETWFSLTNPPNDPRCIPTRKGITGFWFMILCLVDYEHLIRRWILGKNLTDCIQ